MSYKIIFTKVTYKNFLSCGNSPISIQLNKTGNTLIIGKNGSGKSSSVTDSITFALFGKPFRDINKPTIVNSENDKDCLVEIEFQIYHNKYLVRRGIKPNVFEIYKNGKMIPKESSVEDYQKYLETNILRSTYKTFIQIVILGSASFIPFMQLQAKDRREITENLLDCQVFSVMHTIAKLKASYNKSSLEKNETKRSSLIQSSNHHQETIERLKAMKKIDVKGLNKEKAELQAKIEKLQKIIDKAQNFGSELKELNAKIAEFRKQSKQIVVLKAKMENNVDILKKEISFFKDNEQCPTCSQTIDLEFKKTKTKENNDKIKIRCDHIKTADENVEGFEKQIKECEKLIDDLNKKSNNIRLYESEIRNLRNMISDLDRRINEAGADENLIEDTIKAKKKIDKDIDDLDKERAGLLEEKEYLDQANLILKDGRIKTKIIKKYIPLFNKVVNRYLSLMNLYVNFTIDENFNEKILSRFKTNYSYANFSEGEKMRINLAILFAWREVAQVRNSVSTNLLVMDELFDSSLDGEGTDDFIKIMLNEFKGVNLFVISHKQDALKDKFQDVIEFEKVKGFTRIKKEI